MEGVILSSWDYIMGPQIERLWLMNYNLKLKISEVPKAILKDFNISRNSKQSHKENKCRENCDLRKYSLMCGQVLLGEMDAYETFDENVSRTYISDSKVLIGVVFRMKSWKYHESTKEVKNACLCIGLIYKRSDFHFILENLFAFDIHLRRLAVSLQNSKLPQETMFFELSDTVTALTSLLDSSYKNLQNMQNHMLSSAQDYLTPNVLSAAIVSHLQTSGHTAILGGSEFKINQVINILSLFNNKEELSCSLPLNHTPLKSKVSSFYIQGIIKNSERDCEYLLEHAFQESLSLTVIDTDLCKVWQTCPFQEHIENRFCTVAETGSYVPQLLKDLSFADKNKADCQNIVESFMKCLMIKAVAVIKSLTHFRDLKRISSYEELMTLFAINSLVDLQIILGCAEKLKPRIRCSFL